MSAIQSISIASAQTLASVAPQSQSALQPFANLNLTSAQRDQLRSIFASAKANGTSRADVQQQINAVLTPAQQQTLKGDLAEFKGHGHHHDGSGDSASQTSAAAAGSSATASASASVGSAVTTAAAQATTATTAASTANTTDATILAIITNLQNQVAAAQSVLDNTLHAKVVAATSTSAPARAQSNANSATVTPTKA